MIATLFMGHGEAAMWCSLPCHCSYSCRRHPEPGRRSLGRAAPRHSRNSTSIAVPASREEYCCHVVLCRLDRLPLSNRKAGGRDMRCFNAKAEKRQFIHTTTAQAASDGDSDHGARYSLPCGSFCCTSCCASCCIDRHCSKSHREAGERIMEEAAREACFPLAL